MAGEWGGKVASLTTGEESNFVNEKFIKSGFIGGIRLQDEDNSSTSWEWTDGLPWSYNNWNAGEPNDAGNNEDCIDRNSGGWNDVPCDNPRDALYKRIISEVSQYYNFLHYSIIFVCFSIINTLLF